METVKLVTSVAAKYVRRYKAFRPSVWNLENECESLDDKDRRESRIAAFLDDTAQVSRAVRVFGPHVIDDLCEFWVHFRSA